MGTLADIVFDCAYPARLARFWAAAMDGYRIAPYDDAELARLRELGITDVEDDPGVIVEPSDPSRPRLYFQKVPEPKQAKNRVHLDLRAPDIEQELARLVELGARPMDHQPRREDFIVLRDPEDNEFCLVRH